MQITKFLNSSLVRWRIKTTLLFSFLVLTLDNIDRSRLSCSRISWHVNCKTNFFLVLQLLFSVKYSLFSIKCQFSIQCSVFTVQNSLFSIYCSFLTVQYSQFSITDQYSLFKVFTVHSFHYSQYSLFAIFTVHTIHCSVFTVQYSLFSIHCSVFTVQYSLFSIQTKNKSKQKIDCSQVFQTFFSEKNQNICVKIAGNFCVYLLTPKHIHGDLNFTGFTFSQCTVFLKYLER